MNNNILYIIVACIFVIILISTIIMIKNIFSKGSSSHTKKTSKNIRKRMEGLRNKIALNSKDLDSLYELAVLEEEYGDLKSYLEKYEALIDAGYFDNAHDRVEIYKKLDIAYTDKESYDLLTKVTEEDLLEFLSRLKLDTIYFLKEMQDE